MIFRFLSLFVILFSSALQADTHGVRLKDLASFEGVRGNDLVGYGLVVGLDGTGDGLRNAPFTEDTMSNILERLGVNVTGEQFRARNVAAVIVTGRLEAFARAGNRMDVTVSAIGDASSLRGGTLVMTPLHAADGEIYAVAQGSIIAGGVAAEGNAARVVQGVPTAGSIPSGATVEKEIEFDFAARQSLKISLKTADFSTAARIERAINAAIGRNSARMADAGTVLLQLNGPDNLSASHIVASIENLLITPDTLARVVVDQRSGTVVISKDVKVSRVAVAKGDLTLTVQENPVVVQPNPFAEGESLVVPRTSAQIEEDRQRYLAEVPESTSLSDIVTGLNSLGITPEDLIDILRSIKAAGALHAELVVM
ncbi:flagellar basal body P-ring protein FlgI [Marivita hallyeonensis]|uniref:Flagellar P-ring protein n=1 Tax=Marivita hallyeonensis TaxID=996342 RepID=A0A1M5UPA6_9RHOB|nr:flagellar basal body P-ring protein FlgI [Marivita hallyeonensis]SHH64902.1 flagellar P-ring protein precursor FlgI [Marivita hallyeonensis]